MSYSGGNDQGPVSQSFVEEGRQSSSGLSEMDIDEGMEVEFGVGTGEMSEKAKGKRKAEEMEEDEGEEEEEGKEKEKEKKKEEKGGEELDPYETDENVVVQYMTKHGVVREGSSTPAHLGPKMLTKIFLHWRLDCTRSNLVTDLFFPPGPQQTYAWSFTVLALLVNLATNSDASYRNAIIRELVRSLQYKKSKKYQGTKRNALAYDDLSAVRRNVQGNIISLVPNLPEDEIVPADDNTTAE